MILFFQIISKFMNQITSFRGHYAFLSNFSIHPVEYKGILFKSSEHAFQWEKAETIDDKKLILNAFSPMEAKKISKTFKIDVKEWDSKKFRVMEDILIEKFSNDYLKRCLKSTSGKDLIEGNYWHDNIWGSCSCNKCEIKVKQNNLGKLLMKIRDA